MAREFYCVGGFSCHFLRKPPKIIGENTTTITSKKVKNRLIMEEKQTVLEMMQNDPTFQYELAIIGLIRNDILNASLTLELQETKLTIDRKLHEFDFFYFVLKVMGFSIERIQTSVANFYLGEIKKICSERNYLEKGVDQKAMELYYKLKKLKG